MDDDEPLDDDVVEAHLPADQPHARWFLRRFAASVGDYYRTMDPHVAQVITAPGVLPVSLAEPETR
ncbi:MAG TPA: hypothetical protein VFE19_11565 [Jatrophihabitantaceae bacterium]|nr:hypothetical protein [Jatrophihabitantaceae bacterium]